jgi:hypothetical protein
MRAKKKSWYTRIPLLSNDRIRLVLTLIVSIFFFISSLEGVKNGFKLIFAEWQGNILAMITGNTAAITGLALGMLSTSLVQSSSAVVAATMVSMSGMVAGGLPMGAAIKFGVPMILGANIGTTVTNTIVAFGIERGMTINEFKLNCGPTYQADEGIGCGLSRRFRGWYIHVCFLVYCYYYFNEHDYKRT